MDLKILGSEIRERRKAINLTQKQLGEMIGKTESSIQKYESGATEVPLSVLGMIADALGSGIIDFLDTNSIINLWNERDDALFNYLRSLGYNFKDDPNSGDYFYIEYHGYSYKLPEYMRLEIIEDIRSYAQHRFDMILSKFCDNRTPIKEI